MQVIYTEDLSAKGKLAGLRQVMTVESRYIWQERTAGMCFGGLTRSASITVSVINFYKTVSSEDTNLTA